MSSLFLPAPVRSRPPPPSGRATAAVAATGTATGLAKPQCPTYEERCDGAAAAAKAGGAREKLFVPRSVADFDDGGAFPEIHVAQYPRHMGNPHLAKKRAGGRSLLSVAVGAGGEASYDAVVTGGTNADKTVYASHSAVVPARPGAVGAGAGVGGPSAGLGDATALPTDDEERRTAERTLAALGQITQAKSDMARPTGSAIAQASTSGKQEDKTQFVRYKPREDAPGYNPAAAQRVVQMVPAQIDPMQPPKHMHRKAPRGPAEDPVPVLHAPPEKLSKEEREAWNVPACISNWKNTRGYTIPLDKRLAADGRGLREEATINSNFATLSESLYVAERQAREEVRMRSQVQKRLAVQEKERREEELRDLAARARRDRAGIGGPAPPAAAAVGAGAGIGIGIGAAAPSPAAPSGPTDEQVAAEQRERLRQERRRERERELREEKRGAGGGGDDADGDGDGVGIKKRRLEDDRDVSEKIALGTHTGAGGGGAAGIGVDSRLYNQSAGMDSGFGAEDDYNVYTKPMFDRDGAASAGIYRPTRGEGAVDADEQYAKLRAGSTTKFQPDRSFKGADGGAAAAAGSAAHRTAPVQFERGGQK